LRFYQSGEMEMRDAGELAEAVTGYTLTGESLAKLATVLEVKLPNARNNSPSRSPILYVLQQTGEAFFASRNPAPRRVHR
jgi:hypothetical protein